MKIFQRANTGTIKQTLAIYRKNLGSERKHLIIAAIFIPIQQTLYTVVVPLIISLYVQELVVNPTELLPQQLLIASLLVVGILSVAASRIGFFAGFNHQERMTTKLSEYAVNGLLSHSHSFFANNKTGALAGEVNAFSRSYLSLLDTMFLQASSVAVNFVFSLIIVAFVAPLMLPALILLTVAIVALALRSYNQRGSLRSKRKELQSRLMGTFGDIIGNQTLVRMFGRQDDEVAEVSRQRRAIEAIARKEVVILENNAELRVGMLVVFQLLVLMLCGYLISQDLLSVAALIFIITYLGRVTGSLFAINSIVRTTEQAFLDAAKITEILSASVEVMDKPNAPDLTVRGGDIDMTSVRFAHEDSPNTTIFEDLTLRVPAGQSIGLVGRSGGGKSTLTHLLLRYMDVHSGSILIDGTNISDVTQSSLRANISYVPQEPYLFHRTLRENIAYGMPEASDELIRQAIIKAQADEFINQLPGGLDTIVGERGVKLSGGQRQRVAIARAILKDAPILILDEATSALDSESERYIQKALKELMKNRTSIVIAHRLSTIAKLDRIIVLDDGKIVEDGTHAALLKKNGVYAKLWSHQSGGFIEN